MEEYINGIKLENISLKYKEISDKLQKKEGLFNGDYCFGNMVFNTKVYYDGKLFLRLAFGSNNRLILSYPLGEGDKYNLLKEVCLYAKKKGLTPVLGPFTEKLMQEGKELFSKKIEFSRKRNSDDYVYLVDAMISLSGKELHPKKNMLNSFLKNEYDYEKIDKENLEDAKSFCLERAYTEAEAVVMERFFDNYEALCLTGAIIKIKGKIVAATVGERNEDTVIIHIEKAEKNIRGAYAGINNLFLKNDNSDLIYVNREDDMGQENLRKAKLSYKPHTMIKKYMGILPVLE